MKLKSIPKIILIPLGVFLFFAVFNALEKIFIDAGVGLAVITIVAFLLAFYYETVTAKKLEKQAEEKRFEGQVAGVFAMMELSDVCCFSNEIFKFAMCELKRCRSLRGTPPDPQKDKVYYASLNNFAEFALLCTIKYFEEHDRDKAIADAVIKFCETHLVLAGKMAVHPGTWE